MQPRQERMNQLRENLLKTPEGLVQQPRLHKSAKPGENTAEAALTVAGDIQTSCRQREAATSHWKSLVNGRKVKNFHKFSVS